MLKENVSSLSFVKYQKYNVNYNFCSKNKLSNEKKIGFFELIEENDDKQSQSTQVLVENV